MMQWISTDIVTLNGKQHRASVDRTRRQIIFSGDVLIRPTDIIVVTGMTGVVDTVEHEERCTTVTLGGEVA